MQKFLENLGIEEENSGAFCGKWLETSGEKIEVVSPIDDSVIASVKAASQEDYEKVAKKAQEDFKEWRMIPAPKRGEIVRQIGLELRKHKDDLGKLVTLEMGKILTEGEGEVQEMIDIADFAVGLSRQLYGKTMQSERPNHRMYEQWHPLGVIGIISAFNFPVAVWAWNAFIAAVCGDTMIWKPSSTTPLTAIAVTKIVHKVLKKNDMPTSIFSMVVGRGRTVGEKLINDKNVRLISATGSCQMGKRVHQAVAKRYGKVILELGGNNAIVVMEDANLELALKAVLFGAVGTAGQRCTTTRRVLLHASIFDEFAEKLKNAYSTVSIGNPLDDDILMGPVVNQAAVNNYQNALEKIKEQGGEIIYGGNIVTQDVPGKLYLEPTIAIAENDMPIVQEETFAPILYLIKIKDIDQAIELHNDVPQGLSSAIFTENLYYAEQFLSHKGSDCGIANVNIGTSGAEIGGAFGGEKETGGGREAGSDAWKAYMRRQTNTINWGKKMPLAQGVEFDI
ncbi:MAG: aldehyde dehydrogenase family protein [Candidatus Cloacimonetes bacterium]|nr:aldehyde dehydrogenase family protein [Candidatus Cloacimonadota bacterium]MBS3768086.1 aldehyde dehydrogenase family protein [Candidatus Cloacimonadota bacterium]